MSLEHGLNQATLTHTQRFNLLWRSNVVGTSDRWDEFLINLRKVSISFGDLMSLEPQNSSIFGLWGSHRFNLLWRSNVVGTLYI